MELYFSDYFSVEPGTVEGYGAFNISVVTDLPLFIDPFLLFNSEKAEYQRLHERIIRYLKFLRDQATPTLSAGLVDNWYRFREVKQNWLGFTEFGNEGHALGKKFAAALHQSLGTILSDFGEEQTTRGSHLEKLALIKPGVGRDGISDFTTNLIKDYLCSYTEAFADAYLEDDQCATFGVVRAAFNYSTLSWETRRYRLPKLRNDYVLLTPIDMLTRDDTWINHSDMLAKFDYLPDALGNEQLRDQVSVYFRSRLSDKPNALERAAAAEATIMQFRELIDVYIKLKEDRGDEAESISLAKTQETLDTLVEQIRRAIPDLASKTDFYDRPWTSYEEVQERVRLFKNYVENQDGYKLINEPGKTPRDEKAVQLYFGLIWCNTDFDVNREPNNGRGPVDFKVSFGAKDKSLIEFKLAKSSSLKRNLEKQVAIYEKANGTRKSVKVVICYTEEDQAKIDRVLSELGLQDEQAIVIIDARHDNKPSASKA